MENSRNYPPKAQHANQKGLIFEYLLCQESKRTLILLDGLPAVPYRKETMDRLYQAGFNVFFPRYRGTWESEGSFLSSSPTEDIKELIEAITAGIKLGNVDYVSNDINILSSSFGGAVAWPLSEMEEVKRAILLSPVYDFNQVVGISTLKEYLKTHYTMGYRFIDADWDKLISNKLIATPRHLGTKARAKCYVVGGGQDPQIKADTLAKFCTDLGIQFKIYQDASHLSLTPKNEDIWTDIMGKLS